MSAALAALATRRVEVTPLISPTFSFEGGLHGSGGYKLAG